MRPQNELEYLVGRIVAEPSLHARWLNTFSYLEYVGFRKIVKSQRAEELSAAILSHACEEGRHALGLKKLALKLGGAGLDTYLPEALLCGEAAGDYFQALDRCCDEAFADRPESERARLAYCYVTWLVERRALDVYGVYRKALGESEIARKLTSLLAEETKHLADVEALLQSSDPEFPVRAKTFETKEAGLYQNFVEALAGELAKQSAASETVSG